jgi:hypothetical protein
LQDGKHLVGYTAREFEDEEDFSSGFLCTYTLSLWRFDDNTVNEHVPLQNVFECYLFGTNDEPLAVSGFMNVCVTELNDNLLCVHGWQKSEGESSEHYVSLVSLPKHKWVWSEKCIATTKFECQGICDNGWEIAYILGAAPALVVNTGGSLAYQCIQISESKECTTLVLAKRILLNLDKYVLWLMGQNKGGKHTGVLDLDVRLLGVSEGNVYFNLSILYENAGAVNPVVPSTWMRCSAIFLLCPATGRVDSIRVCGTVPLVPSTTPQFDQMNVTQATKLRHWLNSRPCPILHRLTNISAISGESLTYLYHPFYPVAIRGYPRSKTGT